MPPEQTERAPVRRRYLRLKKDVLLHRRGLHGEPETVVCRLEKGTEVLVVMVSPDKTNTTPYLCSFRGWPDTFWIGRGHEEIFRNE